MAEHRRGGSRTIAWVRLPVAYCRWIVVGTLAIAEPISWGILYEVTAGSVGKPKDGDPRVCYVTLKVQQA